MTNEPIIQHIFSTPLYINNMNRKFSKKEISFIINSKKDIIKNTSNSYTKDDYILKRPALKNIKSYIEKCCDDYLEKIMSPSDPVKLEITQSWINYSNKNEYHQEHCHSNSLVSGVLYINAQEKNDSIQFLNNPYSLLSPNVKNYNAWNCKIVNVAVKTGKIVMFPSSVTHRVLVNKEDYVRISLAFNTFLRGSLGGGLGELKL
tara:strand:- start:293 stop:904 length:612 start_codon:yes stop_codon:yes gene_type:complete